jgi:hypothetical protein
LIMLERIDVGTAIVVAAVTAGLVALVMWGPADHRGTAGLALVGLLGTLAAAVRGRLVKRDPSSFDPPVKP